MRRYGGNLMALTGRVHIVLFLFFLLQSPAAALLDPVDFLALQSIRKSLSDLPGSDFFLQWDFTGNPCTFPGVFCADDHVVSLALGDPRAGIPGLTGRIDPAVGSLSALSELSVVSGRIIGRIPDSISLCSSLRFLALSGNFISGAIPSSLASLQQLRTVDFSYNLLSGEIPLMIASLPALSNLVLCHNRLTGKVPPFPSFSPLLRLDLKHNILSGELPALPPSIRYLSVASNRLCGQIDAVVPHLTALTFLDLSMNYFTGQIPATLFTLPVSSLRLQRNMFSGTVLPPADVTIPEVDLSYNRLSGSISPFLAAVGRLYLNNNRFTGELPVNFAERLEAAGMEVLYLQHNFLRGMQISPAAAIPMTTSLCLQYNCMVPPVDAPCPLNVGMQKTRPVNQCPEWRD